MLEVIGFLVSIVQGLKPRDETEAILATQIAVGQAAAMRSAGRLARETGPAMLEMHDIPRHRIRKPVHTKTDLATPSRIGAGRPIYLIARRMVCARRRQPV